jgi:hypothetical protein
MLHLTPSMNYYLYPYPADMRRGFHSLSGLIHDVMGKIRYFYCLILNSTIFSFFWSIVCFHFLR